MVPWNKLPKDLQKAILAMIVMGGGTIACGRVGPMVCDPPPPPTTTSLPTGMPLRTPMICDPASAADADRHIHTENDADDLRRTAETRHHADGCAPAAFSGAQIRDVLRSNADRRGSARHGR